MTASELPGTPSRQWTPRSSMGTGDRFGRLTVLTMDWAERGRVELRCGCDCGATVVVESEQLRDGTVTSCGCASGSRNGHGDVDVLRSRERWVWR